MIVNKFDGGIENFANKLMIKSKMVFSHSNTDDILLNNFQIKKKRFKVLLNFDHIVWERLDAKHCSLSKSDGNVEKKSASAVSIATKPAAVIQKGLYSVFYSNCYTNTHIYWVIEK